MVVGAGAAMMEEGVSTAAMMRTSVVFVDVRYMIDCYLIDGIIWV